MSAMLARPMQVLHGRSACSAYGMGAGRYQKHSDSMSAVGWRRRRLLRAAGSAAIGLAVGTAGAADKKNIQSFGNYRISKIKWAPKIMFAKYPSLFNFRWFILFIVFSAQGKEKESQCYENMQHFMRAQFGENDAKDENLISTNIARTHLIMITDNTPTLNPVRYLLKTKNSEICLVLVAQLANEIIFGQARQAGAPATVITRGGGQGSDNLKTRYNWNCMEERYELVERTRGTLKNKRKACT